MIGVEHLPAFLSNHLLTQFLVETLHVSVQFLIIPLSQGVFSACLLKLGLDESVSNSGRPITDFRVLIF